MQKCKNGYAEVEREGKGEKEGNGSFFCVYRG
jgi:hypothetical protein